MDIRFVIDEHLRGQLWQALASPNQRGVYSVDVVRVGDPADLPRGTTDPDILLWAEREVRILVSGDHATMLKHFADHLRAGHHSAGLFLLRSSTPLPEIVEFLVAVAYASDASEWSDVWRYIP